MLQYPSQNVDHIIENRHPVTYIQEHTPRSRRLDLLIDMG